MRLVIQLLHIKEAQLGGVAAPWQATATVADKNLVCVLRVERS